MAHEALDTFVMEDGTTVQKGRIVSSTHPGVLLDEAGKLFRPWTEPTDGEGKPGPEAKPARGAAKGKP